MEIPMANFVLCVKKCSLGTQAVWPTQNLMCAISHKIGVSAHCALDWVKTSPTNQQTNIQGVPWGREYSKSGQIGDSSSQLRITSEYFFSAVKFCPIPCIRLWWLSQIPYMVSAPFQFWQNFKRSSSLEFEKLPLESDLFPLPGSQDKSCVNIKSWPQDYLRYHYPYLWRGGEDR